MPSNRVCVLLPLSRLHPCVPVAPPCGERSRTKGHSSRTHKQRPPSNSRGNPPADSPTHCVATLSTNNQTFPRLSADRFTASNDRPINRPLNWAALVNEPVPASERERLKLSFEPGQPLGNASWTRRMAEPMGLQYTLNPRGRPRKKEAKS